MNVVFRTDSSSAIGSGHVMRCMTLAEALKSRDASVSFVCRELPGHLGAHIVTNGYPVHMVSTDRALAAATVHDEEYPARFDINWEDDARQTEKYLKQEEPVDWLVVDHYGLDERWHEGMRPRVAHIMVVDDLADRMHDCDLLVDQNYYDDLGLRYDRLVPEHCRRLLGPEYAMLRPEFAAARRQQRVRDGSINRILIFLGGADPQNVTQRAAEAIRAIRRPEIAVDIVIGAANPHAERLKTVCRLMSNCTYHYKVDNMAALMAAADLAIGAPGSATWERCCMGLPTIFIATARNEVAIAQAAEAVGIGSYLGMHYDVTPSMIANEIRTLLADPLTMNAWSEKAASLVDGTGVDRVCRTVCEYLEAGVAP